MPIYNAGLHLSAAIMSIINQSYTNWELLIIDDGSTDGSLDNINNIKDCRIKIFKHKNNKGLAYRLNESINIAKGTYFARMDQDDICHSDRFKKQIEFIKENPGVNLIGTSCILIDEKNNILGYKPYPEKHHEICKNPWAEIKLAHPTWLGRTEWFLSIMYAYPAPYLSEDQEFLLRAYKMSKFHCLQECLLAYRIRNSFSLLKRTRTRYSLLTYQVKYFIYEYQIMYAILSLLILIPKVIKDITIWIKTTYFLDNNNVIPMACNPEDYIYWTDLIKSVESKIKGTWT